MWVIQYEDKMGQSSGVLAHGADDEPTCIFLMEEFARQWISDNYRPGAEYQIAVSEAVADMGANVAVATVHGAVFSINLELQAFKLQGVIKAQSISTATGQHTAHVALEPEVERVIH
jgi:hypothetical protein